MMYQVYHPIVISGAMLGIGLFQELGVGTIRLS